MKIEKTTLMLLLATTALAAALVVTLLGGGAPPAHADPPVKWTIRCFDAEKAGVTQAWLNHDLYKPEGWNAALKRLGEKGWEPVSFLTPSGGTSANIVLQAVCFKRPKPAAAADEE